MDATIEQNCNKLVIALEDMIKSYRQLLELVRKEKEILVSADHDKLNEMNQAKESLLFKIRAHDSLRSRYAAELAHVVGADTETPRLLEIAQKMGGPQADRLRNIHSALDMLIKRIVEINKENEEYTKSALRTLGGALTDLKGTLSGGKKTYERKGQYKIGPDVTGNFVKKEV